MGTRPGKMVWPLVLLITLGCLVGHPAFGRSHLRAVDESLGDAPPDPPATSESADGARTVRPKSALPSDAPEDPSGQRTYILTNLQKYAGFLDMQMADLQKQNATLLATFDKYGWKIAGWSFKAGLQAYGAAATVSTLKTAVSGSLEALSLAQGGAATSREAFNHWVKYGGGKDFLVMFGLNVGLSGVASKATTNSANWSSYIPVYGSIKGAYTWSKQMFSAANQIQKNGDQYLNLMRERQKVQRLIDTYQSGHDLPDLQAMK